MKTLIKHYWPSWLVALGVFAFGYYFLDSLPERVATHYNWHGLPDRYFGKQTAIVIIPFISLIPTFFFPWLIHISPPGFRMRHSQSSLARMIFSVVLLMNCVQLSILGAHLWPTRVSLPFCVSLSLGLFLTSLGLFVRGAERNFFIGFRTPWAMLSEENWTSTQSFAGKCMTACGGLIIIATALGTRLPFATVIFALSLFAPFLYSGWLYSKKKRTMT